jgi:ABC-type long-subunit fatty acid transport system fused permease/ATPase subunit
MRRLIAVVPSLWRTTLEIWYAGFVPYFLSRHWKYRWRAYVFTLSMMALIVINVVGAVLFSYQLNDWGSALQVSTIRETYIEIVIWSLGYLALFIVTDLLVYGLLLQWHIWYWQQALMTWHTDLWSAQPKGNVGTAAQRIQECSEQIAQTLSDICSRGFRYLVGLIGFVPVVWSLSEHFQFILPIPGLLVWATLFICAIETALCLYLGRRLPGLDKLTQEAKARYRSMLEKVQRRRVKGEAVEAPLRALPKLIDTWRRRKFKYIRYSIPLSIWQHLRGNYWGYGIQFHLGYYVAVTLIFRQGVMSQTVAAVGELHKSLSIFSDSWQTITQLQATVERIRELELGSKKNRRPPM